MCKPRTSKARGSWCKQTKAIYAIHIAYVLNVSILEPFSKPLSTAIAADKNEAETYFASRTATDRTGGYIDSHARIGKMGKINFAFKTLKYTTNHLLWPKRFLRLNKIKAKYN
jgi:hypothetical protein